MYYICIYLFYASILFEVGFKRLIFVKTVFRLERKTIETPPPLYDGPVLVAIFFANYSFMKFLKMNQEVNFKSI